MLMMTAPKDNANRPEILTVFLRRDGAGALSPLSLSFGDGAIRVRYGFRPGIALAEALDARFIGVVEALAARGDVRGALRLPETDLVVNGVRLQGSHVIVVPGTVGAESVTIRFERCSGDVRGLLLRGALPAMAQGEPPEDVDAALLREVLIPLINLRRHLSETLPRAAADPAQAFLRIVAARIGDIEERFFPPDDDAADPAPAGAGVRAALEGMAARAPSCLDCIAGRRLLARLAA